MVLEDEDEDKDEAGDKEEEEEEDRQEHLSVVLVLKWEGGPELRGEEPTGTAWCVRRRRRETVMLVFSL